MKTCPSCRWARSHGLLSSNRKDWRCYRPEINRLRPAFLAGDPQAAMRCFSERSNVTGLCGTKGRLWEAASAPRPLTLLEETWETPDDVQTPAAFPGDAPGREPVRVDPADGGEPPGRAEGEHGDPQGEAGLGAPAEGQGPGEAGTVGEAGGASSSSAPSPQ